MKTPDMKISCLVLAAGESRRMGDPNKLLLPIAGKSMVRRTIEEVRKFPFHEVIVITGHEADAVRTEVNRASPGRTRHLRIIHNPDYLVGMHSSIRSGIREMDSNIDGFVICLSDQPLIHSGVLHELYNRFHQDVLPKIVLPAYHGAKGHPVFISHHFVQEILSEPDGDYGCRYLFQRYPQRVYAVDVDDMSVLMDLDTLDQYREYGYGL